MANNNNPIFNNSYEETKYYVAADLCMEVASHPGTLTKEDIIKNIARLLRNEGKQMTESQLNCEAEEHFHKWRHRYEWMVGLELRPADRETAERIERLKREETLAKWWFETYANLD